MTSHIREEKNAVMVKLSGEPQAAFEKQNLRNAPGGNEQLSERVDRNIARLLQEIHRRLEAQVTQDWQVAMLANLSQVEDFLDALEANGIEDRQVVTLGNSSFAVRWRMPVKDVAVAA